MAAFILLVSILGVLMVAKSLQAKERIGCFRFNLDNTVLSVKAHDNIGSIAACVLLCQTRRAIYAGVRVGYQCYCGDSHDHQVNGGQLRDSRCTYSCNDDKKLCGDHASIVIYSVNTTTQPTTFQSEDEHLPSSDGVSDMVTMSAGYVVSEHMTAKPALSMTPCIRCPTLLVLYVTSVGLVISIIVNIYLAYRLRVARIPDKQSSANVRATHNSSDRNSNDTQYENMGGVQTEPSNYEHLGSRQTNPATYEELGMAGHRRG